MQDTNLEHAYPGTNIPVFFLRDNYPGFEAYHIPRAHFDFIRRRLKNSPLFDLINKYSKAGVYVDPPTKEDSTPITLEGESIIMCTWSNIFHFPMSQAVVAICIWGVDKSRISTMPVVVILVKCGCELYGISDQEYES